MDTEDSTSGTGQSDNQYTDLKKELIEIAVILEKYPEPLRPKVFEVLLGAFRGKLTSLTLPPAAGGGSEEQPAAETLLNSAEGGEGNKYSKPKKRAIPDTYSIDPDLNLHGGGDVQSFEKFVGEKQPNSNVEFNAVAVYYITKILKKPRATLKQTWTCYKDVKRRTPDHGKFTCSGK